MNSLYKPGLSTGLGKQGTEVVTPETRTSESWLFLAFSFSDSVGKPKAQFPNGVPLGSQGRR